MSPKQLHSCHKGYRLKEDRAIARQDELNHLLGRYIAIGFNNPSKYPDKAIWAEQLVSSKPVKKMSDNEMNLRGKLFAQKYGKVVDGNNQTNA